MNDVDPVALPESALPRWVRVEIAEEIGPDDNRGDSAGIVRSGLANAVQNELPMVVVSTDRLLVSDSQIAGSVELCEPGWMVLVTAAVTDTVRNNRGGLIDRSRLVEVCAPVVIGGELAVRLLADKFEPGPATVSELVTTAKRIGAVVVLKSDDGSGAWAGRSDALSVVRATVEP